MQSAPKSASKDRSPYVTIMQHAQSQTAQFAFYGTHEEMVRTRTLTRVELPILKSHLSTSAAPQQLFMMTHDVADAELKILQSRATPIGRSVLPKIVNMWEYPQVMAHYTKGEYGQAMMLFKNEFVARTKISDPILDRLKVGSWGLGIASAGLAAYQISRSETPAQEAIHVATMAAGGIAGGFEAGLLSVGPCAFFGVAAPLCVATSTFVGGIFGTEAARIINEAARDFKGFISSAHAAQEPTMLHSRSAPRRSEPPIYFSPSDPSGPTPSISVPFVRRGDAPPEPLDPRRIKIEAEKEAERQALKQRYSSGAMRYRPDLDQSAAEYLQKQEADQARVRAGFVRGAHAGSFATSIPVPEIPETPDVFNVGVEAAVRQYEVKEGSAPKSAPKPPRRATTFSFISPADAGDLPEDFPVPQPAPQYAAPRSVAESKPIPVRVVPTKATAAPKPKPTPSKAEQGRAERIRTGNAETAKLNRASVFERVVPKDELTPEQYAAIFEPNDPSGEAQAAVFEATFKAMTPEQQKSVLKEMGHNIQAEVKAIGTPTPEQIQAEIKGVHGFSNNVAGIAFAAAVCARVAGSPKIAEGAGSICSGAMVVSAAAVAAETAGMISLATASMAAGGILMVSIGAAYILGLVDEDKANPELMMTLGIIIEGLAQIARQIIALGQYLGFRLDALEEMQIEHHRETMQFLNLILYGKDRSLTAIKALMSANGEKILKGLASLHSAVQTLADRQAAQTEAQLRRDSALLQELHFLQTQLDQRLVNKVRILTPEELDLKYVKYTHELAQTARTECVGSESFTSRDLPVDIEKLRPVDLTKLQSRMIVPMEEKKDHIRQLVGYYIDALLRYAKDHAALDAELPKKPAEMIPNLQIFKDRILAFLDLQLAYQRQHPVPEGERTPISEKAYQDVEAVIAELTRVIVMIRAINIKKVMAAGVADLKKYHTDLTTGIAAASEAFEVETTKRLLDKTGKRLAEAEGQACQTSRYSGVTVPKENMTFNYCIRVYSLLHSASKVGYTLHVNGFSVIQTWVAPLDLDGQEMTDLGWISEMYAPTLSADNFKRESEERKVPWSGYPMAQLTEKLRRKQEVIGTEEMLGWNPRSYKAKLTSWHKYVGLSEEALIATRTEQQSSQVLKQRQEFAATRAIAAQSIADKEHLYWFSALAAPSVREKRIELPGKLVNVDPYGNCFFLAIAHEVQRQHIGWRPLTHSQLRRLAVDYLKARPQFLRDHPPEGETASAYLKRMANDGTWAEGPIIEAMALALTSKGVHLTVLEVRTDADGMSELYPIHINDKPGLKTIAVVREGLHYQALEVGVEPTRVRPSKLFPKIEAPKPAVKEWGMQKLLSLGPRVIQPQSDSVSLNLYLNDARFDQYLPANAMLAELQDLGRIELTYEASFSDKKKDQQTFNFTLHIKFVPNDSCASPVSLFSHSIQTKVAPTYKSVEEVADCLWNGRPVFTASKVDLSCDLFEHKNPFYERKTLESLPEQILKAAPVPEMRPVSSELDAIRKRGQDLVREEFSQRIAVELQNEAGLGGILTKMEVSIAMIKNFAALMLPDHLADVEAILSEIQLLKRGQFLDYTRAGHAGCAADMADSRYLHHALQKEFLEKIKTLGAKLDAIIALVPMPGDTELDLLHDQLTQFKSSVTPVADAVPVPRHAHEAVPAAREEDEYTTPRDAAGYIDRLTGEFMHANRAGIVEDGDDDRDSAWVRPPARRADQVPLPHGLFVFDAELTDPALKSPFFSYLEKKLGQGRVLLEKGARQRVIVKLAAPTIEL